MRSPPGKSADFRRRSDVSRREYLRAASAAGVVGLGLSATVGRAGAASSLPHTLTIASDGSYASYTFTVSGNLEADAGLTGEDEVSGSTATGAVAGGRDSYAFSGDVTAIEVDSGATVLLDGEPVTPAELLPHTLTVGGSGSFVRYAFAVSGDLEAGVGLTGEDEVSGSVASGAIRSGRDSYAFSGDITDFRLSGDATLSLDGNAVDATAFLPDTLTVEGRGSYATYEFAVSGGIAPRAGLTGEDDIDIEAGRATGAIRSGRDSYAFSAEITDFELDGDAAVYRNGERVDPDSLGDGRDDDLKLGYDARARSHQRGRIYENFEEFSKGWYPTNGDLSADTDWVFDDDSPASARLDGYADDDRIGMAVDFEGGKSFVGRDLSLAVRLGEAAHETLRVELWAQDAADQYVATRYLSRADDWVRIDLGPTNVRGSPNLADVRRFGVECYTGGKRVRMNIDSIRTTPRRDSGAVILTFDDNHHTQYDVAFPEMQRRGMVGTVGVIHDLVGDDDRISLAEMREMRDAGWTMASHPQGDDPSEGLGRVSRERAERMMRATKGWLVEHGFAEGARCLIWPYGDHDRDSLELAGEYHELSFGGGSSPCPGVVTEAAWVPRVDADDVNQALDAINAAARFDQVLMLMVHTVGEGRISTNDFERLLNRIEARDLDVLTASEFADEQ